MENNCGPPGNGRSFYFILDNGNGTVDVILDPRADPRTTPEGYTDYDIAGKTIVRGVPWRPDLETEIRARFYDWCDAGEQLQSITTTKGEMSMNSDTENVNDKAIFEAEGAPSENQRDSVFALDGRGRPVKQEVPDDDEYD